MHQNILVINEILHKEADTYCDTNNPKSRTTDKTAKQQKKWKQAVFLLFNSIEKRILDHPKVEI